MIHTLKNLPKDAVFDEMDSPVGVLILVASKQGLHAILWGSNHPDNAVRAQMLSEFARAKDNEIILATKQQLHEYFQGKRTEFDLPLAMLGTEFQIKVWQELQKIPYGQTLTYGEQACRIGNKNKARAVGMANGLNPISIVVPCHRVIGRNGNLTGFGGGLDNKAYLLNLERGNHLDDEGAECTGLLGL